MLIMLGTYIQMLTMLGQLWIGDQLLDIVPGGNLVTMKSKNKMW